MDHQDIPGKEDQKEAEHQGVVARPRGRPRKSARGQTAGSDAPAVEGFSIPDRPEVETQEKQDGRKFIVLPFRVYNDKQMTRQALRVLVMLAAHANRNGFLWCGVQRIADDLGITQEAVSQQMTALKQAGYIEETAKPYYGGPTARTATLRVVYDPTMSAEDVTARDSGREDKWGQVGLMPNIQESDQVITSLNRKEVNVSKHSHSKVSEHSLTSAELAVVARYRAEGLEPPTGARLASEAALIKA